MVRGIVFAGVGLVLLACAPQPAVDPGSSPPSAAFAAMDTNADAAVDRSEWHAAGDITHAAMDADADGIVTRAEYSAGFDVFDADGDGVLSPGEVDAAAFDTDGDGVISRAEWEASNGHAMMDVDGDGRVDREEYRAHRTAQFVAFDANNDGRALRAPNLAVSSRPFALIRF